MSKPLKVTVQADLPTTLGSVIAKLHDGTYASYVNEIYLRTGSDGWRSTAPDIEHYIGDHELEKRVIENPELWVVLHDEAE